MNWSPWITDGSSSGALGDLEFVAFVLLVALLLAVVVAPRWRAGIPIIVAAGLFLVTLGSPVGLRSQPLERIPPLPPRSQLLDTHSTHALLAGGVIPFGTMSLYRAPTFDGIGDSGDGENDLRARTQVLPLAPLATNGALVCGTATGPSAGCIDDGGAVSLWRDGGSGFYVVTWAGADDGSPRAYHLTYGLIPTHDDDGSIGGWWFIEWTVFGTLVGLAFLTRHLRNVGQHQRKALHGQ